MGDSAHHLAAGPAALRCAGYHKQCAQFARASGQMVRVTWHPHGCQNW